MSFNVVELAKEVADASEPRRALAAIADLRAHLARLEEYYVGAAVARGASWGEIGAALGVTKQAAHKRYARKDSPEGPARRGTTITITGAARQAVHLARREAAGAGRRTLAPEHLLLGLLLVPDGAAAGELGRRGVTAEAARAAVGDPSGPPADPAALPVAARTRTVFERALEEAVALGDGELGDVHLLAALLAHGGSSARRVLAQLGIDAGATRSALLAARRGGNVRSAP